MVDSSCGAGGVGDGRGIHENRPPLADGTAQLSRPAFYAAGPGRLRDWWTLLHPPYTAWHLSYVVIGACLAPRVSVVRLVATLLAFFLAVGVAAHALDELHGRPLRTEIPSSVLVTAAVVGLAGAVTIGCLGIATIGWTIVPCIVAGPLLVIAYNAELFGGVVHTDAGFAVAWGAFPVITAYVAQASTLRLAPVLAAGAAFAISFAQRSLSTPARFLRRKVANVYGELRLADGTTRPLDQRLVLYPMEKALRSMSWGMVLLATAVALSRLT